jgi:Glyoxalase-like domain
MNSTQPSRQQKAMQHEVPVLPVPTLDHVVVNICNAMAEATNIYRRLGFTLTPEGRHTLGSINHLAIFGTDYLELVGVPPEGAPGTDVMNWPAGLNAIVFGTDDSDALYEVLARAGAPVLPPLAFSRPVALPGGARDAAFRTVRVTDQAAACGRLYFCHHLTRDLVWRDEWRRHANGVVGVAEIVVAATDPARLGGLFRTLFGADAVVQTAGGLRLCAGLASIDVVDRAEVERRFGRAAPAPDGRHEAMVGLVLRTSEVGRAEAAMRHGGIETVLADRFRVLVPASETCGVALEFRAA